MDCDGPLSICLVSRVMPIHGSGGMQNHTWAIARGLAARGHVVHVITAAHPSGRAPRVETSDGVTMHYAPSAIPRRYTRRWWQETRSLFISLHEAVGFDLIVSADAGAFPLLSGRNRDGRIPPCVMIRHGTTLGELRAVGQSPSGRKALAVPYLLSMYLAYGRRLLPRADMMIAVTERVRTDALREAAVDPARIVVVPNGVDTEFFTPASAADAPTRLDERFHVLGVGRIIREKGFDLLLHAIAALVESGVEVRVSLAGDGRVRPSLERLTRKLSLARAVTFVGELDPGSLRPFYQSGDLLVVPSRRDEGLPLALLEGMASGLPVIASTSAVGGMKFDEGNLGLRFDRNDLAQLTDCLRRFVARPESERRQIGEANRSIAVERHSLDEMVRKTEAILAATASGESSS